MKDKRLEKAKKLLRKEKYDQVIALLEKEIFQYRENYEYFQILGLACLYSNDFSGADSYLQRAVQIDLTQITPKLGLAVIALRRHKTAEAIKIWLSVLELEEKNSIANRALSYMKKYSDPKNLSAFLQTNRFKRLFPYPYQNRQIPFLLAALLLAVAVLIPFIVINTNLLEENLKRKEIAEISLPQNQSLVAHDGNFQKTLTGGEIEELFQKAKRLINDYRDNEARVLLNTIRYSNASPLVKSQSLLLEEILVEPGFDTLKKSFTVAEVSEEPFLYENCYVRWKGRVSNLDIRTDKIEFDFLVGYHERKVLEGIIPVTFNFAVNIEPELPLEILGQLKRRGNNLSLRGVALHTLLEYQEKRP